MKRADEKNVTLHIRRSLGYRLRFIDTSDREAAKAMRDATARMMQACCPVLGTTADVIDLSARKNYAAVSRTQ